jgi:hypothetical protein
MNHKILIDAHIHIHKCFDLGSFLNSAKINFLALSNDYKYSKFQFVLCLSESHNINFFKSLVEFATESQKIDNWQICFTENDNTLVVSDNSKFEIFIISGRQIVTKENLEVLALGLTSDPEEYKPINEVIKYVYENKSLSVIPWGVGKWLGKRKQIVEDLILQNNKYPIYLGDNGNRPFFWRMPKLFNRALAKGVFNIAGSDPLPFISEINKPGSYGIILNGNIDSKKPFEYIFDKIVQSKEQFETYGKLESIYRFLKNQILMQIEKRRRKDFRNDSRF